MPPAEDLPQLVASAPRTTFRGVDADRWRALRPDELEAGTERLWATAQVIASAPGQMTDAYDALLVLAWCDEPALAPVLRALVERERPITVLLGGPAEQDDAVSRANHALLVEMVRRKQLAQVLVHEQPDRVLDVALTLASDPVPTLVSRTRPVDIGPALELGPTWFVPASPVDLLAVVDQPVTRAAELGRLVTLIAAWRAMHEVVHGPPMDMDGARPVLLEAVWARLPKGDVYELVQGWLKDALDQVEFRGEEPLVEQLERRLRPALRAVNDLVKLASEVEDARMEQLRAFSSVGIVYTCQHLRARLDALGHDEFASLPVQLERLMRGLEDGGIVREGVHLTAWRQAFAGLPSCVVRRGEPGGGVALRMVQQRFSMFRGEYASAIAKVVEGIVERAREPDAPPSPLALRELHARACRVRDSLLEELVGLESRVRAGVAEALATDTWVALACEGVEDPLAQIEQAVRGVPAFQIAARMATEELARRPLGMADGADFEGYLYETVEAARTLAWRVEPPSMDEVGGALLARHSAADWVRKWAGSGAEDVQLALDAPPGPRVAAWLAAGNVKVRQRGGWPSALLHMRIAPHLSSPTAELMRRATGEHFAADLLLPPPEGDTASSIAALVRASALVLLGLALGELSVRPDEGGRVAEVSGVRVALPRPCLLPFGALHALAWDDDLRARLEALVQGAVQCLYQRLDAIETVQKLLELGHLGPAPSLVEQLGLAGARFEHLLTPLRELLLRAAEQAAMVLLDHLPASAALEVLAVPERHVVEDLAQLARSGYAE